ncbi:MAG: SIS domain-containing protein [Thermosphaera sp.]
MGAYAYWEEVKKRLAEIETNEIGNIRLAADIIYQVLQDGGRVFIFGCAHSAILAEEMFYRAGGLVFWNPIHAPGLTMDVRPISYTTHIERIEGYGTTIVEKNKITNNDVVIIVSTSGRNPVPVEFSLAAKAKGAKVIAITSLEYSKRVDSRHSGGKKIYEIADLVVDNHAPFGDAAVEVPGRRLRYGAVSSITGIYILRAIEAELIERMLQEGWEPPIFQSSNLPGLNADQHNRELIEKYRKQITYE